MPQENLGPAKFIRALAAADATTAVPSGSSAGVAVMDGRQGLKIHINADVTRTAGQTASLTLWIYGWRAGAETAAGAAIASTAAWTRVAVLAAMTESNTDFNHSVPIDVGAAYSRYAARVAAISGTGAKADVYIGIS